jgi:uncharacterized protein YeaC (DUF1315 family)
MNSSERFIYNQGQALTRQAHEKRDQATKMYNARVRLEAEQAEHAKQEGERLVRVKEKRRADFSREIENVCRALGDAVKANGMTIEAGLVIDRSFAGQSTGVKLFTMASTNLPRMLADVYAVAGRGFRWEIKS